MVAKQRAINEALHRIDWDQHPGLGESILPVWGSAKEAIADYREGDYLGAAFNGALAAADLTGEMYVGKSLAKSGAKLVGSNTWKQTRKWLGEKGLLEAGQHGHHWAIPRKSKVPDIVKNQPWNIKGMPSPEVHGRIHGPRGADPRFNPLERFLEGTPTWFKVQAGLAAGHAVNGVQEGVSTYNREAQGRRNP